MVRKQSLPKFKSCKVLPLDMVVMGADSQLYRIGLSLFKCKSGLKRSIFYNPFLVFFILFEHFIRNVIIIFVKSQTNEISAEFHLYLADVDHYMNTGIMVSLLCSYCGLVLMGSQLINYNNYKNDIKPVDLRVLEMIAGLIPPESIGIRNEAIVKKLVRICRVSFKMTKITLKFMTSMTFITGVWMMGQNASINQFVFVVLPRSILWAIWIHHFYAIVTYQIIYYFIITYYLRSKLREINLNIQSKRRRVFHLFFETLRESNKTYEEINEYNAIYWSKFLFIIWLTFSSIISTILFIAIIVGIEIFLLRILLYSYVIYDVILLNFTIIISSQIHLESNRIYYILNSYIMHLHKKTPLILKLKVSFSL